MDKQNVFTLINQQNDNLAFKLFDFKNNSHFDHLQRNNFYTILWVKKGNGLLKVDFSEYLFKDNVIMAFSPYQPFMISSDNNISGIAIQFHSDFYCIHKNPNETNCDTVLFNNIYESPFFSVNSIDHQDNFNQIIRQLKTEIKNSSNINNTFELIVPILKILLVTASRLKSKLKLDKVQFSDSQTPFILKSLKVAIEKNYKEKHSASQYAELLNISSNALGKIVKTNLNKTLTELITERIIMEAKRELYMTNKTVKEIAWDLGYADEYYFSRLFKSKAEVSPQVYRDTVGFGKAEMN